MRVVLVALIGMFITVYIIGVTVVVSAINDGLK